MRPWNGFDIQNPTDLNTAGYQYGVGNMAATSAYWQGGTSARSDRTMTPGLHREENNSTLGDPYARSDYPARPMNSMPFEHQLGAMVQQTPHHHGNIAQSAYNVFNQPYVGAPYSTGPYPESSSTNRRGRKRNNLPHHFRRMDQGPVPSAADKYPDDAVYVDQAQGEIDENASENTFESDSFFLPSPSDQRKRHALDQDQVEDEGPDAVPELVKPRVPAAARSYRELPDFLRDPFILPPTKSNLVPDPVEDIKYPYPDANVPENDQLTSPTTRTTGQPTTWRSVPRPSTTRNPPTFGSPNQSRSGGESNGHGITNKYGLRHGGLGLLMLGDTWMPPSAVQTDTSFGRVRYLWDNTNRPGQE